MSSITTMSSAPTAPVAGGKAACAASKTGADATDAQALDFGALLGAGLEAAAEAASPSETVTDQVTAEDPVAWGTDPNAILDAIAAAQATDVAPAAATMPTPILPAMAPAVTKGTATTAEGETAPPFAASKTARRASADSDGKPGDAAALRADTTKARFDPANVAPRLNAVAERGAAGELRAEAMARPVTDSQALTHLMHAQQPHRIAEPVAMRLETLQQPMGTPAWNDRVADRVVWMAKNDVQVAELHLNPADLGPIEITLTLSGDDKSQAAVQFSAAHAATREAIETALPRLRDMLQESGITLGQAGVDADNSRAADSGDRQAPRGHGRDRGNDASGDPGPAPLPVGAAVRSLARGLVDTFA